MDRDARSENMTNFDNSPWNHKPKYRIDETGEVKNFNHLLVQLLLSYLQHKIGVDAGVEPGADMKAAIEEAE